MRTPAAAERSRDVSKTNPKKKSAEQHTQKEANSKQKSAVFLTHSLQQFKFNTHEKIFPKKFIKTQEMGHGELVHRRSVENSR